ncbi:MAG: CRISPR-associated endonuclease Cas1 [Lentimicrobiaceae bacterium]|nr:CRISPR-associated endonuclease Cas1 [Lentimicrobiaceae bacterium]
MQIVLDSRGLQLSVRNKCFLIEAEKESRIIHPQRISSILITAPCRMSSPAIILAAESQIPVVICNTSGKPQARLWSPMFLNTSSLRRKQYLFTTHERSLVWAEEIIKQKIQGQTDNLVFVAGRKSSLNPEVEKAVDNIHIQLAKLHTAVATDNSVHKKQILFCEAYAAACYWQLVGTKLPLPFTFTNRVKREPADAFNACINYLYGMLRNQAETAVLSMGLDPALGVMHRDGYHMPSLVFDLMEPFRPVMDRILINAILQNQMPDDIIEVHDEKYRISKAGRKQLIGLFYEKLHSRMLYKGISTSLQNHLLTEVKLLTEIIKKV